MSTIYLLIGVNVALYGLCFLETQSPSFNSVQLVGAGALYAPLVKRGQIWRLYTSAFLHVRAEHIIMNMLALFQVGAILATRYGSARLVLIYGVGGIGGSLASFAWRAGASITQTTPRYAIRKMNVSAGASGAISAMIGAAAVLAWQLDSHFLLVGMLRWGALVLVFGLAPFVDNMAHLGGMVTGAGLAYVLGTPLGPPVQQPLWWIALLVPLAISLVLARLTRREAMAAMNLVNDGVARARAGDLDGAIERYRAAIDLHEKDALAHFNLAVALAGKQDVVSARAEVKRAVEIDPKWPQAVDLARKIS